MTKRYVLRFLNNIPERIFTKDFEKNGYEAFLTESNNLMVEPGL